MSVQVVYYNKLRSNLILRIISHGKQQPHKSMAENSQEKTNSGGGHASAPTCASVSDLPHTFADVPKTTLHTMDHSGAKPETPTSERRRATDCTMDTLAKTLDF